MSRRLSAAPALPAVPQSSSYLSIVEDTSGEQLRHGPAHLAGVFGSIRRESARQSTSGISASRRFSTIETHSPQEISDLALPHKPSPLPPKRKPLPKGSPFEKLILSQDDGDLNGKLGNMDIRGGPTMVRPFSSLFSDL